MSVQPFDEPLVLNILYQCADGLQHMHSTQLVHRDVRADNYLVGARDPLRMLITDFGLVHKVKDTSAAASMSFTLIGPVGEACTAHVGCIVCVPRLCWRRRSSS